MDTTTHKNTAAAATTNMPTMMTTGNYDMKKIDGWHLKVEKNVVQAEYDDLPKQSSRSQNTDAELLNIPQRTWSSWIQNGSIIIEKEKKDDTVVADAAPETRKRPAMNTDEIWTKKQCHLRAKAAFESSEEHYKKVCDLSFVAITKFETVLDTGNKAVETARKALETARTEFKTVVDTGKKALETARTGVFATCKMVKSAESLRETLNADMKVAKLTYEDSERDLGVIDIDDPVAPIRANFDELRRTCSVRDEKQKKTKRNVHVVTIIDTRVMWTLQNLDKPTDRNEYLKSLQQKSIKIKWEHGKEELVEVSSIYFD